MATRIVEQTPSTPARPTAPIATDASRFVAEFAQAFGADAPAIFDQLSADDHAAMMAIFGAGSVTMHQATMAIIDDGLTVLCARVRHAGQAYQLWQPIHDVDTGPAAITACWYVTALPALDAAPDRACTPTGAILADSPAQALQTLILTVASHGQQ